MLYTELSGLPKRNSGFRVKILDLTVLLNEIQISQRGESQGDAITQTNDEFALLIFKNRLAEKLKIVICVAQLKTFLSATK